MGQSGREGGLCSLLNGHRMRQGTEGSVIIMITEEKDRCLSFSGSLWKKFSRCLGAADVVASAAKWKACFLWQSDGGTCDGGGFVEHSVSLVRRSLDVRINTASRSEIAQFVLALARWTDGHQVRKHRHSRKESSSANQWLEMGKSFVPVAFEHAIFEVTRVRKCIGCRKLVSGWAPIGIATIARLWQIIDWRLVFVAELFRRAAVTDRRNARRRGH